jgi:hypothetical protein
MICRVLVHIHHRGMGLPDGGTKRGKIQRLVAKSFGEELLYEMHIVLQCPHGQPPLL